MTGHEGERRQKIPLLLPPAFSQFVVADQNRFPALTEARVDVESDVVPAQEVDREPGGGRNISNTFSVDKPMIPSKAFGQSIKLCSHYDLESFLYDFKF